MVHYPIGRDLMPTKLAEWLWGLLDFNIIGALALLLAFFALKRANRISRENAEKLCLDGLSPVQQELINLCSREITLVIRRFNSPVDTTVSADTSGWSIKIPLTEIKDFQDPIIAYGSERMISLLVLCLAERNRYDTAYKTSCDVWLNPDRYLASLICLFCQIKREITGAWVNPITLYKIYFGNDKSNLKVWKREHNSYIAHNKELRVFRIKSLHD
jgi:hypothetical protein